MKKPMANSDPSVIRMEVEYPHPRAAVWRALTDPARMARWLMPNDFKLEVGHRFTLQGEAIPAVHFQGIVECEVIAYQSEEMLRFSWRDPGVENRLDSVVSWWLEPIDGGTRVVLEHRGFDMSNPFQQLARKLMGGGWRNVLRRLGDEVPRTAVP